MNILIVDDSKFVIDDLIDELSGIVPDAKCMSTCDPSEVPGMFEKKKFEVVFMDIDMPGTTGIYMAKKILKKYPRTNIIYITGYPEYALETYETPASAFLTKPLKTKKIRNALENLRFPVSRITDDDIDAAGADDNFIGRQVKKYREEGNITCEALAEMMDVSVQTIYRWERGERIPQIQTLIKLARIFGTGVDDMIFRGGDDE